MNVVFVSIDSLSKAFVNLYGYDIEYDVKIPNLARLAAKSLIFDNHYSGSLPCMPARREYFSGIQEFLWRPWGPMEPFDRPMARAARECGAVSQLVTDHYHYFQHGSHGYYEDYNGYEFIRGHESDTWQTAPKHPNDDFLKQIKTAYPDKPTTYMNRVDYARNVANFDINDERDFFPAKVFSAAANWIDINVDQDKWLLVIDCFDVHEPFQCPEPYASMYTDEDPRDPDMVVWPMYGRVDEGPSQLTERQLAFVRSQFAGKITMVDRWLGDLLDAMDRHDLWEDTMFVLTTDHGHYLGEHGWIGKPDCPFYNTLAQTPLFIHHPQNENVGGRTSALTSAVDIYATVLEALEADPTPNIHSTSLMPLITGTSDHHRDWVVYGYWGSSINVSDGKYTYFHPCDTSVPAESHSTMMLQMAPWDWFQPPQPHMDAVGGRFLPYTQSPVWKYSLPSQWRHESPMLFDVERDPLQLNDLAESEPDQVHRMQCLLWEALRSLEAPASQFARLRLESSGPV